MDRAGAFDQPLPTMEAVVRPHKSKSKQTNLLAFAELKIAGAFVIKNIRVMTKNPGERFVVFPAERGVKDAWYDIAHPTNRTAWTAAVALILDEYDKKVKSAKGVA